MPLGEIVGSKLCRHPAPTEGQARADHRHDRGRAREQAQQVWQQAREPEADKHERDRQLL